MLISNHKTGVELQLLQPPLAGRSSAFPSWVLPVTVLLAGSDAASALVDPALPLLISGSLAVAASGAVASNTLLLPRLKQLPINAVKLETIRQQLLAQHADLEGKVKVTVQVGSGSLSVSVHLLCGVHDVGAMQQQCSLQQARLPWMP
jgi:hypothetical protein